MSVSPSKDIFAFARNKTAEFLQSAKNEANSLIQKANRVKGVVVTGSTIVYTTASQAAVTYTDGELTGSLDLSGYHSAMQIVIPAAVTIVVGGVILRAIKKI